MTLFWLGFGAGVLVTGLAVIALAWHWTYHPAPKRLPPERRPAGDWRSRHNDY